MAQFWKFFSFFAVFMAWAQESLCPDQDGVVRITADELAKLAHALCAQFGWKAEIVMPTTTEPAGPAK